MFPILQLAQLIICISFDLGKYASRNAVLVILLNLAGMIYYFYKPHRLHNVSDATQTVIGEVCIEYLINHWQPIDIRSYFVLLHFFESFSLPIGVT